MCRLFELADGSVAVEGVFFGARLATKSQSSTGIFLLSVSCRGDPNNLAELRCQNSLDQEMPLPQCEGDTLPSKSK